MNFCRTCKHWAVSADMIGLGICQNVNVWFRIFPQELRTAQNFGCVLHADGECKSEISSREQQNTVIDEFLMARR